MSETNKNLIKYNARVVMKHDTKAHWEAAVNFIPLAGELIVYDDIHKIKIGDGTTKVNDLPFSGLESNLGEGLLIDPNTGNLRFDDLYIANYYWADENPDVLAGRIGLMSPKQAYNIDRANMLVNNAVNFALSSKPMGFYKFSTTSYGFIQEVEPVTAEDIEGMEINTATSGATANTGKVYIVGAEEQATTAKTFTNAKAYIDKNGYVYSNNEKTLTSSDLFDSNNTIKSSYLPSYVDDVIEGYYMPFETTGAFLDKEGEGAITLPAQSGKIYVDLKTNKTYRWSGTRYIEISSGPLALGNRHEDAFYGDLGQIAYDHASHGINCGDFEMGLYKIQSADGHIEAVEAVTRDDMIAYGLGYNGGAGIVVNNDTGVITLDTGYYASENRIGLMTAADYKLLHSIEAGANKYVLPFASATVLGGIKVGESLKIDSNGVLSVDVTTHKHNIEYTPEGTATFAGDTNTTSTASGTTTVRSIKSATATATVSCNYSNRCLELVPEELDNINVALYTHTHTVVPTGTITFTGEKAELVTGKGWVALV